MIDDDNPSIIIKKKKMYHTTYTPVSLLLFSNGRSVLLSRCSIVSIRLLETDLLVLAPTNINTCSRDAKPTPKNKEPFWTSSSDFKKWEVEVFLYYLYYYSSINIR